MSGHGAKAGLGMHMHGALSLKVAVDVGACLREQQEEDANYCQTNMHSETAVFSSDYQPNSRGKEADCVPQKGSQCQEGLELVIGILVMGKLGIQGEDILSSVGIPTWAWEGGEEGSW